MQAFALLLAAAAPIFLRRVERASPARTLFDLHQRRAVQIMDPSTRRCHNFILHHAMAVLNCAGAHLIALASTAIALPAAQLGAHSTPIWLVQSSRLDFQPKEVAAAIASAVAAAAIVFVLDVRVVSAVRSAALFRRIATGSRPMRVSRSYCTCSALGTSSPHACRRRGASALRSLSRTDTSS